MLSHVTSFLKNPALAALSSTAATIRAGPVGTASDTVKEALKRSVCAKIVMDEEELTTTSTLYCQKRALTDEEGVMLVFLLGDNLARITTMWLFSNALGDGTARALARAFTQLTRESSPRPSSALKLRVLWLSNNRIGCQGVSALAESLASQRVGGRLIELCLGENQIGRAGCEALTALFNVDEQERPVAFPELTTLVLERNPLPPEALRMIRCAVRNVESISCSCGRRVSLEL